MRLFKNFFGQKTFACLLLLGILALQTVDALPQEIDTISPREIKKLSVEELMNIEVTSVSKKPEKLTSVASAIQVITRADIQRSAATNVGEALQLASNLQANQLNSRHWAISSRGFTSTFSNKLLVMIDGRTVYSPLYAGVFWDAQSVLLEDVDRIEIISGPGSTLWGANAVNGVINIITRNTRNTQGLYVSAAAGTELQQQAEVRYGGKLGSNLSYRVYANHNQRNNTVLPNGNNNTDNWRFSQTGFAMDWDASEKNVLSFQGNFYQAEEYKNPIRPSIDGQNLMGKWTHNISGKSSFILQAYADRTWRISVPIDDELYTYDVDLQHNFPLGKNHNIIWGAGYRYMDDRVQNNTQRVGFLPEHRTMQLFSGFVQDEITLIPQRLSVTVGTKLQHTTFTGFELQPSARVSYTPASSHLIWAAVSHAVRAPSRIDVDYFSPPFPVPPTTPNVAGGPDFSSEKLLAHEIGYRVQPASGLTLSLAAFYNNYDDLYSIEQVPGTRTFQIQNGARGNTHGIELASNYVLSRSWSLRGGYTYFHKNLQNKPANISDAAALEVHGTDVKNQALLQSALNLPANFKVDVVARYLDFLPATRSNRRVPAYVTLDSRIAWEYKKQLELSISGQNLLKKQHLEIGNGAQIQRGVYGRIIWRY